MEDGGTACCSPLAGELELAERELRFAVAEVAEATWLRAGSGRGRSPGRSPGRRSSDLRRLLLRCRAMRARAGAAAAGGLRATGEEPRPPACADHMMDLPVHLAGTSAFGGSGDAKAAQRPCHHLSGVFKRKQLDRKLSSSPLAVRRSLR